MTDKDRSALYRAWAEEAAARFTVYKASAQVNRVEFDTGYLGESLSPEQFEAYRAECFARIEQYERFAAEASKQAAHWREVAEGREAA